MRKLTSKQAVVFTSVIFLLTIGMSFWLPGYSITIGGLLLGIFLTPLFLIPLTWLQDRMAGRGRRQPAPAPAR